MTEPQLGDRIMGWFRRRFATGHSPLSPQRGPRDHVIILDGTMSTLIVGEETNAGLTYRLLCRSKGNLSLYYEAGVQWSHWRTTPDVMMGRGINRQIRRAYGYLASRYRPGDRIFLIGYSRGAYAVRSLAGVIDMVGLLRADKATVRNIRQVYRLYRYDPNGESARAFAASRCHPNTPIEVVGVWDTVKALGLRLPLLWRLTEPSHAFHSAELGHGVRNGYHALAIDETRAAYTPVLWQSAPGWEGHAEQVWFRGTHGDVGGQLGGFSPARPLSNIPLVWMLSKLEHHGLSLPEGWRQEFPCDADAPSCGTWRGVGKLFLIRGPRQVGGDASERVHETVPSETPAFGSLAH